MQFFEVFGSRNRLSLIGTIVAHAGFINDVIQKSIIAAAVLVGTVALTDYVSGTKQAREALKDMADAAKQWKDSAADTFYGRSEGRDFQKIFLRICGSICVDWWCGM